MTTLDWKTILHSDGSIAYWRRLSDGRQESVTPDHPEFLAWLAEGNTPEPAPEPTPPPELTPEQKLAASGLSVEDLRQLLGLDP
jgi:hypothetical protein